MNRSATGSPVAAPDCGAGCSSVGQWLAGLGLADYESLFHNNGFDDLEFIVSSFSNWRMSVLFRFPDSSLCTLLQPPVTSCPLGPHVLFNALLSRAPQSVCLSDPFRARGFASKLIVSSVLICELLCLLSELLNQVGWDGQGV